MYETISVIIPAYNVEKYLADCMDSILTQTYENLEILLINDGSTDQTGVLCDEYARADGRVRVLHKENSGQADCRNIGVRMSSGEYIAFVDSDDRISKDYFSFLYQILTEAHADIAVCEFKKFWGEMRNVPDKIYNIEYISNEQALEYLLYQKKIKNAPCGKLIKRDILDGIEFPVGRLYEDIGTMYKIFGKVANIVYSNAEKYFYRQRPGSSTRKIFSAKKMDRVYFAEDILMYIDQNYPDIYKAAVARYFASAFLVMGELSPRQEFEKEFQRLCSILKETAPIVANDRHAKKSFRYVARIVIANVRWAYPVARIFQKYQNR